MMQISELRRVLLLSTGEPEILALREMLEDRVHLTTARNLQEMVSLLDDCEFDALLCDWQLGQANWRHALAAVRETDPDLPTIVLCPTAEEYEWLEALEGGAFDLLAAPWHQSSLLVVLEHAFASRDGRILRAMGVN